MVDAVTLVRRHLATAAALVIALAVGVALGAGPLSHERLLPTTAAPEPRPVEPDTGAGTDLLAAEATAALVRGRLTGRDVAVLSTPGVDPATVDALAATVEQARGRVVANWTAGESLVGPGEKTLVDSLGEQLLEQLEGRGADPGTVSYERMGQLVGTAVGSRLAGGSDAGDDARTIRQSLDAASLLRSDRDLPRRAPLVVLALGDDLDDHVVEGLVAGLSARVAGLVVTGPEGSADLAVLDEAGAFTTVDGGGTDLGRLAVVLALAGVEEQPVGSYGASGSESLLPLG